MRVGSPQEALVGVGRHRPRPYNGMQTRLKGDPMIMLLALPDIAAVFLARGYLVLYAPSNVLIRRVREAAPALSTAAAMLAVASSLIVAMKVVSDAIAAGAPGWLNMVVLVLAWDAIKIGCLGFAVMLRWIGIVTRRTVERQIGRLRAASYS